MKDKSTPENRAFWADVAEAARIVATWPAWKRGESASRNAAPDAADKAPR